MRRIGMLLGFLFLLLFAASLLAVTVASAALGGVSSGTRLAAGLVGVLLFVLGIAFVGRSVRRIVAPIGEVMDAADRVADGDYAARVSARGPREMRRLGHAFNEMTARLQTSDDQRRRLLADVTHELRTPLAVIQGNLEGMVDGVYALDEEGVSTVLEETRVMARLLDDLQLLATADSGVLGLDRRPTELAALVRDAVAAFEPRAEGSGVALSSVAEGPSEALVDPVRVRQVLDNLVGNAVRHTPAGGDVTIRLSGRDDAVEIAVVDTGPGIPPDRIDGIFDRYTRSADSGGTGLGLAIAKALVEAHGGSIGAESEEGRGATLRVVLPRGA
jgi:two-component system, OmpR family, sensor histidine kinase BaeS